MSKSRLHNTKLLREIANRIIEQCQAEGRDDLVAGVVLMETLVRRTADLTKQRKFMLEILEADDWTVEVSEALQARLEEVRQAEEEAVGAKLH